MRTRTFLALGFLVILGGALYLSLSFPKQAKVMPLLVLIPGVLLALWNFVAEMRFRQATPDQENRNEEAVRGANVYFLFAAAVALPLLSWLFGITIGLPLFMFLYLRWVSKESWRSTIFSTVLSWVVLYWGFDVLMASNFDNGVLIDLILS